jgi:hypothetical protein
MADALPESALAKLDDPFAQLTGPLAGATRLDFEVVDSARLTPHMQRLRLTAPQLDGFGYLPGQDVMLLVAAEGNRPVRRADPPNCAIPAWPDRCQHSAEQALCEPSGAQRPAHDRGLRGGFSSCSRSVSSTRRASAAPMRR